MVSERQRIARKRFKEAHPELFPTAAEPKPTTPTKPKAKAERAAAGSAPNDTTKNNYNHIPDKEKKTKKPKLKKHPLRIPGNKPGESCFICKAQDHIAKICPKKAFWEKNKICLFCRQRGHSLKNCPNTSEGDSAVKKYCYNCGEVGHSLSSCPQPIQDGGTKFANCFICNERGHLSKNCPKNTRGIYPKGGSCKFCGDVTHLARHCPNKGNKDSVSGPGSNNHSSNQHGASQIGKVICSGDDLNDDFMEFDMKNDSTNTISHSKANSDCLGIKVEKDSVKTKKKQGPKVVNFTC